MAKIKVAEISGFGGREYGGYEWGCQVVCARALRFMQRIKEGSEFPRYKGFKDVTGIFIGDNPAAKQMDEFIIAHEKLRECGLTGAMHQFGIMHALQIHLLGREKYFEKLMAGEDGRKPEDFYEFEEEDAFPEDGSAR